MQSKKNSKMVEKSAKYCHFNNDEADKEIGNMTNSDLHICDIRMSVKKDNNEHILHHKKDRNPPEKG